MSLNHHFISPNPSLPHTLNNYELTIAMYLVFSKYGKISIVKASRDAAHRPYGFVEYASTVPVICIPPTHNPPLGDGRQVHDGGPRRQ